MSFLKCWQRDPQGMKRFGSFKAVSLKGISQDSSIKHWHWHLFYSVVWFPSVRWDWKTFEICGCSQMDLPLQCIDWLYEYFSIIKGSHLCLWVTASPNNRTEPITCWASDYCGKHPWDNVCDEQKSNPLLSDDLSGSVCVCEAVWMKINLRTQRLSQGTFTNNVLSIWPVHHSSSQRRGLS